MKVIKNKKHTPYAVVVGIDGCLGLQTARIFARRGVPVVGVATNSKHFCCRTNVCEKILSADILNDDLIDSLISFGKELDQKAVLVPCRDRSVLIISRHRQVLEPYFHVALPQPEVVEMMMDKLRFYNYALKENLPIPKFSLIYSKEDAEKVAQGLTFPCILKPPMKSPAWEGSTRYKAYKIFNADEFLQTYSQCSKWTEILMAQEWITGSDANNYSCNCYFNAKSEPVVTFVARKLRQWPPETGNTSLGQECRNDVVLNESIRLFKKVGFRGLGYLEMKRDERTGKYWIIEPNIGRPTGRSPLAEACGVELLYTMYCDKVGWPLPEKIKQKYIGIKWIYLREDLQSAFIYWLRGDLTIRDWWRSLRGRKTYAVLSWSDPLPFFEDIRSKIIPLISIILKKSLRIWQERKFKPALNKVIGEV